MSSDQKSYYMQWSGVTKPDPYGWAIVHTAEWCHYRKGKKCTVPFPKGKTCSMENCPMRPQDFVDMFPEDYQQLDSDNAALRARVEELEAENDEIRSATMDYTHEIDKLTDRATRAEAESEEAMARVEKLERVRIEAEYMGKLYALTPELDAALAECGEG